MRLVFIYGPPAVGKLTVAKELSRMTGFKLYHNHVSIQAVKPVFDFGTPTFWKLVNKYRKEVIEEAAKEGIDVIFTLVYSKPWDDPYVEDIRERVKKHGGRVCFVRLYCERKELMERIDSRSRKNWGKLSSRLLLDEMLSSSNLFGRVTGARSLGIDTSVNSPKASAELIVRHFKLSKR